MALPHVDPSIRNKNRVTLIDRLPMNGVRRHVTVKGGTPPLRDSLVPGMGWAVWVGVFEGRESARAQVGMGIQNQVVGFRTGERHQSKIWLTPMDTISTLRITYTGILPVVLAAAGSAIVHPVRLCIFEYGNRHRCATLPLRVIHRHYLPRHGFMQMQTDIFLNPVDQRVIYKQLPAVSDILRLCHFSSLSHGGLAAQQGQNAFQNALYDVHPLFLLPAELLRERNFFRYIGLLSGSYL